ncbi:MAG: anti-sigma factor [Chloroflexi bacterium]|nr:anti-sigma factor [Chloroflexota bacterium]
MKCEDIRDLIPAYSMGTASPKELLEVVNHLAECDLHDDLAAIAATSVLIGLNTEPVDPSSTLKSKVMAHVEASSGLLSPLVPEVRRRRLPRHWFVGSPIAAMLVVALGVMVVWNIMLQSADSPERFVHYYWGNENDWMRIETILGQKGAEVSLGGLDRLDDTHRYQLWTTRGEQVLLVGDFNVSPEGKWAGEFDFIFQEGDRVWMTSEPASGSNQPTGETVLRTRF